MEGKPEMNIDCTRLDDLLLEGDPQSLATAAEHARTCDACMEKLTEWNEISGTARTLHTEWQSDLLWPRIERAIAGDRRRRILAAGWRIAAAVVLIAGLGAGSWFAVRQSRNDAFDREILQVSALDEVERAEQAHLAAIDHLEKVATPRVEEVNTPLMVSYREKLMLLDDAIAECQTNINRNRQNAHLRKQLLAIYSEKQRTLEQVMREGNHVSNQ